MQSIMHNGDECYLCHRPAPDTHHCLFGNKRKACDKYGLTVRLCRECHDKVHNPRNEQEEKMRDSLVVEAQKAFEKKCGTRQDFMKIFGRNYMRDVTFEITLSNHDYDIAKRVADKLQYDLRYLFEHFVGDMLEDYYEEELMDAEREQERIEEEEEERRRHKWWYMKGDGDE